MNYVKLTYAESIELLNAIPNDAVDILQPIQIGENCYIVPDDCESHGYATAYLEDKMRITEKEAREAAFQFALTYEAE